MAATVLTNLGRAVLTNRIKGSGTEPLYMGWGTGTPASDAAVTDVALFVPAAEARTTGSSSQTTSGSATNNTYQDVGTIIASAARAITEYGQFDSTTAAPSTTLSASATSGATTFSVVSTGGFTPLPLAAQIDNEVVTITATGAGPTFTVTRAVSGTSAATHASGLAITAGNSTSGLGGNLFIHANFAVVNLASGDSIAFTSSLTFT